MVIGFKLFIVYSTLIAYSRLVCLSVSAYSYYTRTLNSAWVYWVKQNSIALLYTQASTRTFNCSPDRSKACMMYNNCFSYWTHYWTKQTTSKGYISSIWCSFLERTHVTIGHLVKLTNGHLFSNQRTKTSHYL